MKVLFAVSNENISEAIIKKYQQMYKEIISSKNVYYFNAILKELQKDKTYDRIVISEDLEPLTNKNYEAMDNGLFEKLDAISDEASDSQGENIPVILISTDRRAKGENMLVRLFGIGIYDALIGDDRSVEQVCNLISKPRSKKEAKMYYKIAASEVIYKPETEDVSEVEIQNILAHYKKLGKNTEKYIDSFMSIANQYSDAQLKIIIQFLPLGVKAVLESECPKYQEIMTSAGMKPGKMNNYSEEKRTKNVKVAEEGNAEGIKSQFIDLEDNKRLTKPVIIPSELKTREIPKAQIKAEIPKRQMNYQNVESNSFNSFDESMFEDIEPQTKQQVMSPVEEEILPGFEEIETPIKKVEVQEPVKKGRGRPKKIETEENEQEPLLGEVKRRGRPKKVVVQNPTTEMISSNILPGFEEDKEEMLPGFEEQSTPISSMKNTNTMLSEFEEETIMPGFEEEVFNPRKQIDNLVREHTEPRYNEYTNEKEENLFEEENPMTYAPQQRQETTYIQPQIEEREYAKPQMETRAEVANYNQDPSFQRGGVDNLLTANKKIVGFVGTSKNGVSFLVNNIAQMLSAQGIKTAILDLTKNKNAYYIYTKNEEELRKIAVDCMEKLNTGIAKGIPVNRSLDVYTTVPGEEIENLQVNNVLQTLLQNYELVLVDCDFNSNYQYIAKLQELYLVQSMDVLTIQPLTAYLKDLKTKGILNQEKLKIVINKYIKVRSISEKTIIGGMAFYNDPAMSFMSELFNRESIQYTVVPFEMQTYSRYLEGLVNCDITLERYSKMFIAELRKLANMVYPLVAGGKDKYEKQKSQVNQFNNSYEKNFSNNMNDTLGRMKKYQ